MKLEIASWNDGATSYNALAEETNIISFTLDHRFNEPATCTILLSDPTGALAQKYNVDANDVFVGPGKVELEHPTATDIFQGRIVKVRHNSMSGKTVLTCRDWANQLEDRRIVYDMREDLDGSGLRQSEIKSDVGDETLPVTQNFLYAKLDDGGVFEDFTAEAADDSTLDVNLLPAVALVDDAFYFGLSAVDIDRVMIDVGQAGAGTYTITWEYFGTLGADWHALSDVVDGTNNFKTLGLHTVSWTVPVGGDSMTLETFDGDDAYWVRARVSALTSYTNRPRADQIWEPQILYDDDMTFDADEWNGKNLVFPSESNGLITILTGPYADTAVCDVEAGGYDDVWLDDANYHHTSRNGAGIAIDYDFHINAEMGDLYSSGPSVGKVYVSFICYNDSSDARDFYVYVKTAAEVYRLIASYPNTTTTSEIRMITVNIPTQYLSGFVDTLGEVTIRLATTGGAGEDVFLDVYYCLMELKYTVEGTSSAYVICDTKPNEIHTEANITYEGLGLWETCPYCVADYIKNHIPTLITDYDPLVTLSTSVEATTGVSTRHYEERTPWEIIRDLGEQEGAVVYVPLGGVTVTYKKTFNNGAPTAMTDATVCQWQQCEYDYESVRNEYHLYGVRIGDNQLYRNTADLSTDPGADSKSTYGTARSDVFKGTGLLSQYEVDAYGRALVEKNEDVRFQLGAELAGLDSTYRLATEVAVTSTRLGLAAANYTVTGWRYDSARNRTSIDMHPRVSVGYMAKVPDFGSIKQIQSTAERLRVDTYTPALSSQDW